MSQWTHVLGAIRFDGLDEIGKPDLGKTVSFRDPREKWDECTVPCGSEGSLEYYLYTDPDDSNLARWCAVIWGDLRDYNNELEVLNYFNRIVKDNWVRQGCFTVAVEGLKPKTYQYNEETEVFVPLI